MTDWPSVSVIMPILDEERHLRDAVCRVLAQGYPGPLEIVLAVGPCQDATPAIAAELSAADPRVRLVANPSGRTPDALNAALAAARHDVIVRVDGHSELCAGYVATAVQELQRPGVVNVGGVMDAQGQTPFERAVAAAMKTRLGVGNARFHVGGGAGPAETVYLGVFRRRTLLDIGGYDSHYTRAQDWELNHRLRAAGGTVWFTPRLRVTYRPRPDLVALARQYFEYGRWRRVVAARHTTISLRYLAPPSMVVCTGTATVVGVAGAIGVAVRRGRAGRRWRTARAALVVPGLYAAGIAVGGIVVGRREGVATRAILPAVLATMHWSWGLGFLTSPRGLRAVTPGLVARDMSDPDGAVGGIGAPAGRP